MEKRPKIVGTGLICSDIIFYGDERIISNGGTCANVLSILSLLDWNVIALKPKYEDDLDRFVEANLDYFGVKISHYKYEKKSSPRVIELLNKTRHSYLTYCPKCNRKILNLSHIGNNRINVNSVLEGIDIFFYDRISNGIRDIVEMVNNDGGMSFYEPNGCRNFSILIDDCLNASIVKFSKTNIPMSIAEKIRNKASEYETKIIIVTDGEDGLIFSHKSTNGDMTEWQRIPPFKSDKIIDTSGAGDWLTAGFINYLITSWDKPYININENDIVHSLMKAREYSKLCCASIGAQGVFLSEDLMDDFIRISNSMIEKKKLVEKLKSNAVDTSNGCDICYLPYNQEG